MLGHAPTAKECKVSLVLIRWINRSLCNSWWQRETGGPLPWHALVRQFPYSNDRATCALCKVHSQSTPSPVTVIQLQDAYPKPITTPKYQPPSPKFRNRRTHRKCRFAIEITACEELVHSINRHYAQNPHYLRCSRFQTAKYKTRRRTMVLYAVTVGDAQG